jgi:hypothetical protein
VILSRFVGQNIDEAIIGGKEILIIVNIIWFGSVGGGQEKVTKIVWTG